MANIPTIPENYTPLQVWEILTDPKKAAATLKTILDATEVHNQRLKRFEEFKTVEQYKSQVDADVALAREKIAAAEDYSAKTRQAADTLLGKASAKSNEADARQNKREIYLANWGERLMLKEQELAKREEAVARDLAEAGKERAIADRLLNEANRIRREYEAKLAKMREMAA